jgi:hypothetical protein
MTSNHHYPISEDSLLAMVVISLVRSTGDMTRSSLQRRARHGIGSHSRKLALGSMNLWPMGPIPYLTHQPSLYCLRAEKRAPTLARGWSITLWTDSPLLFSLANRTIHLRP